MTDVFFLWLHLYTRTPQQLMLSRFQIRQCWDLRARVLNRWNMSVRWCHVKWGCTYQLLTFNWLWNVRSQMLWCRHIRPHVPSVKMSCRDDVHIIISIVKSVESLLKSYRKLHLPDVSPMKTGGCHSFHTNMNDLPSIIFSSAEIPTNCYHPGQHFTCYCQLHLLPL